MSSLIVALAAIMSLQSSPSQVPSVTPQAQSVGPVSPIQEPEANLGVIDVNAARSAATERERARLFVGEMTAASFGARPGRWHTPVCVSVLNFDRTASQYIIDRVAELSIDLGIPVGAPGCTPNVSVVATVDAAVTTKILIDQAPATFRPEYVHSSPTRAALKRFETTTAPVRWWQTTQPVSADDGTPIYRSIGGEASAYSSRSPSRFRSSVRSDLVNVFIVLDVRQMVETNMSALGDFIAMISIAQIDPEGDFTGMDTVMNLFTSDRKRTGFSQWDIDYLHSFYGAEDNLRDARQQSMAIVNEFQQIRRIRESGADTEGARSQ